MAKFNTGDRVRIKERLDWLTPSGYGLANLEGQVVEGLRPDIAEDPEGFEEFIEVQLDRGGSTVAILAEGLEKSTLDFKDCVKFATENQTCYVSAAEGDQPRVRALGLLFADNTGFYFQAYTVKAIYKQLKANPKVELCFYAPGPDGDIGRVMRVAGKVKFVDDIKIKAKCLKDRPFLKLFGIEKPEDPRLVIFQVYTGEAYFWTMADNMKESEIKRITF